MVRTEDAVKVYGAGQGISVFSIPVLNLAIVVLAAALADVIAAIMPSLRATKLNILRAIVSEWDPATAAASGTAKAGRHRPVRHGDRHFSYHRSCA